MANLAEGPVVFLVERAEIDLSPSLTLARLRRRYRRRGVVNRVVIHEEEPVSGSLRCDFEATFPAIVTVVAVAAPSITGRGCAVRQLVVPAWDHAPERLTEILEMARASSGGETG